MPDLKTLLSIAEYAAAFAFFLLLFYLVRSGRILPLPFFTAYCLVMVIDLIWHPTKLSAAIWIQPWIISLEACCVIEASSLVAERIQSDDQLQLALFLTCVGLLICAEVAGFYSLDVFGGWYRTMTQSSRLILAGWMWALVIYQSMNGQDRWNGIWLPHLRIFSFYMILRAVWSFLATPGMGANAHHLIRIAWLLAVCEWVMVWLWYDRRELREKRLVSP